MKNKLEHFILAAAVGIVILGAMLADVRTRLLFEDAPVKREQHPDQGQVVEQEALAEVVAFREPVADPSVYAGRENPLRGPALLHRQATVLRAVSGIYKGRVFLSENRLQFKPSGNPVLTPGRLLRVTLTVADQGRDEVIIMSPVMRYPMLLFAAAGLLCVAILFFRLRGVCFAAVLVLASLAAVLVLFPLILKGFPPAAATALFAAIVMALLVALLGRPGRKAAAAVLGASAGLGVAIALVAVFSGPLKLSGYPSASALMLRQLLPADMKLNFISLLACGTVICVLGLVIDLSVGIASAVEKVYVQEERPDYWEASRAGIRMCRDVTGTMLNTLVFVWAGTGLAIFMLPRAMGISVAELFNSEQMAVEILRLVAGGIGLAVAGPATAFIAAALFAVKRKPAAAAKPAPGWMERSSALLWAMLACELVVFSVAAVSYFQSHSLYVSGRDEGALLAVRDSAQDYYNDGLSYIADGDQARAALALWNAIDTDADFGPAHRVLARLYIARRWDALAQESAQRALRLMPDDSDAHCVAGVISYWLGEYDQAEELLDRAIELDPANAEARHALKALFTD